MIHFIRARGLRIAHPVFRVDLFFRRGGDIPNARRVSWRTDCRGIRGEYRARSERSDLDTNRRARLSCLMAASDTVCLLGVFARAASAIASSGGDAMSSSATSAEVGFDARAACASLIACCATAVALSRIDCGSEGFELTSVSNESAVCRRTTAEAKDIQFGNDAYKSFPKLYHVFVLPLSHASSPSSPPLPLAVLSC